MKLSFNNYPIILLLLLCANFVEAAKKQEEFADFNEPSGIKGLFFSSDERNYKDGKSQVNEAKAQESLQKAKKLELAKDYRDAAEKYMEVRLFSNNKIVKADAVKRAAICYEKAGLLFEQFKCIERLLKSYPHQVNFEDMVDKEFAIADKFYAGHRDPEYYSLRWVPWLTGSDKSPQIYARAVLNAPFSQYAAQALLRMAKIKVEKEQYEDALKLFRKVINEHSDSKSAEYAYLNMIMLLTSLSKSGDGDGKLTYEALELIKGYIQKYPKSKELEWVKKQQIVTENNAAKRLYNIAKYYNRYDRKIAAKDYLQEILQRYDSTATVIKAEDMLSAIDPNFELSELPPKPRSPYIPYQKHEMLEGPRKILIVPENSNNKWLLPIRDLGIGDKENLSDSDQKSKIEKGLKLSNQLKKELLADEYNDNAKKKEENSSTNKQNIKK